MKEQKRNLKSENKRIQEKREVKNSTLVWFIHVTKGSVPPNNKRIHETFIIILKCDLKKDNCEHIVEKTMFLVLTCNSIYCST